MSMDKMEDYIYRGAASPTHVFPRGRSSNHEQHLRGQTADSQYVSWSTNWSIAARFGLDYCADQPIVLRVARKYLERCSCEDAEKTVKVDLEGWYKVDVKTGEIGELADKGEMSSHDRLMFEVVGLPVPKDFAERPPEIG
ncbi:unnamed protein product [Durusdinium trenchii]|uniref:Uncharacterized protein n=1 Tax=Durusdinium trenchii TaxID=1381693 RepID=A0ABP0MC89_9DINO